MHETFFRQDSWQGIRFRDLGVPLNSNLAASSEFYSAFYEELKDRFHSYDQFSEPWKHSKTKTADYIATKVLPSESLLSFGCGIGLIEERLLLTYNFEHLALWDLDRTAAHFCPELNDRYVPGLVDGSAPSTLEFDAILMVQVLYAFNRDDAVRTLRDLRALLKPGGRVISIDTSSNPPENGDNSSRRPHVNRTKLQQALRNAGAARTLVHRLRRVGRSSGEQGWGWMRDNACVEDLFGMAGFTTFEFDVCQGQSVMLAS